MDGLNVRDGYKISFRHLRLILTGLGVYSRKMRSSVDVMKCVYIEIFEGSGRMHGYRFMHITCLQAGIIVEGNSSLNYYTFRSR